MRRRDLLQGALGAGAATLGFAGRAGAQADAVGALLSPWRPGWLDIHQISTGRGNACLVIAPDGTSILVDAGASADGPDTSAQPRPDATRRPGEWIGRYARRHLQATGRVPQIDWMVVTHLHPDHLGDVTADTPPAADGAYRSTGVTDVAEILPVGTLIDRQFPDYAVPPPKARFTDNYLAFAGWRRNNGLANQAFRVGAADQIRLRHDPGAFPGFEVRNLAANGDVWTGAGQAVRSLFPPPGTLAPADLPSENMCSIALRIGYGRFRWFSGGDLSADTREGTAPWRDVETPVAKIAGPVSVAVANHHAYFDAVGPESVRLLRPAVWVVPAWHITHPNIAQLDHMLSPYLYPGPRAIFTTDLMPATEKLNARFLPKLASTSGHIVVRVPPGGESFQVVVTDNRDEGDRVKAVFGPYPTG